MSMLNSTQTAFQGMLDQAAFDEKRVYLTKDQHQSYLTLLSQGPAERLSVETRTQNHFLSSCGLPT